MACRSHPEAKSAVISGAAAQDPKFAVQLIGELKFKETSDAVSKIAAAAKTPEERSAALAAFREYAASLTNQDERECLTKAAVHALVRSAAKDGFQAGSQWISNVDLSPKELENISVSLTHVVKPNGSSGSAKRSRQARPTTASAP